MKARHVLMAAVIACMAAISAPAMAETPAAALAFGVVDANRVLKTCDAAKGIFSELEGKRKEFLGQLAKEEDALRSAGQEFEKEKASLPKEKLDAKRKEMEDRFVNREKMVHEREAILNKAFNDSMVKLRHEMVAVVDEVAKERGLSAVLTQDAVMRSLPQMDMTEEVIKRLNAKVKKIPVEWSAAKKKDKKKAD